jgi:hypothetical protein
VGLDHLLPGHLADLNDVSSVDSQRGLVSGDSWVTEDLHNSDQSVFFKLDSPWNDETQEVSNFFGEAG